MTEEMVAELHDEAQLQEPHMRSVYELWSEKTKQKGALPGWHDFRPAEIVDTMPMLAVVEYLQGEDRFRVRFSGSEYDGLVGRDITGTYFDEMPDGRNLEARARRVRDAATPILMDGLPLSWAEQEKRRFVAISLPMKTQPKGPVDQLLYMMALD
jgi:hypothetical protein